MKFFKWKYILPAVMLVACKKSLNINTDPNNPNPSIISEKQLLPTAEKSLGDALTIDNGAVTTIGIGAGVPGGISIGGLSDICSVFMHQTIQRSELDQYGIVGTSFDIQAAWLSLYQGTTNNLEVIINKADANGDAIYAGIAKVLKAYAYSQFVDVFGDIPFSEASKLDSGITYPKFDKDADIYPQLFALLDDAIKDLSNTSATNAKVPSTDDLIYGGDPSLWIKAANTIKLKLYTQERLITDVKNDVSQLINSGNIISATNESFLLPYGTNGATDDRNPAFSDYYATQRNEYISPWFYEILRGYNQTVNTGITDPRIAYYFYNQIGKTDPAQNATDYRDSAFVSIYFGSVGPNKDNNQQNSMTVLGIYPAGGRYDEGDAQVVSGTSGTGAAPYRFITYADVLYLKAELIHAGLIAGDERSVLQQAMQESFKQVDYVINTFVKPSQSVPALSGTAAVNNYINAVLNEFDAGNADRKLQI
ncbi:MAG TPA: SusD/RagB family nutrient-binding outer membrane lipoprotein, partial [Parafilimonas sp.]|nr:SusD/RagB family nutrient-binding outer membrane lipoprotein [Parafilimonas sp.]